MDMELCVAIERFRRCEIHVSGYDRKSIIDKGERYSWFGLRWKILIEVEDDGHGLDEATKSTIFKPFITGKKHTVDARRGLRIVDSKTAFASLLVRHSLQ